MGALPAWLEFSSLVLHDVVFRRAPSKSVLFLCWFKKISLCVGIVGSVFRHSSCSIMEATALAASWESCASVRSRFRRELPWIQWPIPGSPKPGPDANAKKADPRSPTTRALELNVEILSKVLEWSTGEFMDIYRLEAEAGHIILNCVALYRQAY